MESVRVLCASGDYRRAEALALVRLEVAQRCDVDEENGLLSCHERFGLGENLVASAIDGDVGCGLMLVPLVGVGFM